MQLLCHIVLLIAAIWSPRTSNTAASLRGLHAIGGGVIWASGSHGTILRSEDDGFLWQNCTSPDERLDFRGIWAWDADRAITMSSGPGDASRVYLTADGGAHWRLLFANPDHDGFFDAIQFSDSRHGVILGDPVNGRFAVWNTSDGGEHWTRDDTPGLESLKDEGAFAASNSSLYLVPGSGDAFFGTGSPAGARVFHLSAGRWSATKAPLPGIFSIAFDDAWRGVAVGGDYKNPAQRLGTAAFTVDGGKNWVRTVRPPGGYRSTVVWSRAAHIWMAAGTNGSDISRDNGQTWSAFDATGWNVLSLPWAAGSDGRLAVINDATF